MAEAAPSTAAGNPLEESLQKILGKKTPLSKTTGTQAPISYDPSQTFRPTGDTINLSNVGGAGVSTPEQWTHDIQLANQKQQELEFEYQKSYQAQQAATAAQQAALENARQQAQLGISQAAERRAAAMAPSQMTAAQLQNQQARQAMDVQRQQQELANYAATGYLPEQQRQMAYQSAANLTMGPLAQANAQRYLQAGFSPSFAYSQAYVPQDPTHNPQAYMRGGTTLYNNMRMNDELNNQIYAGNAAQRGLDWNVMNNAMQRAIGGGVGQWSQAPTTLWSGNPVGKYPEGKG